MRAVSRPRPTRIPIAALTAGPGLSAALALAATLTLAAALALAPGAAWAAWPQDGRPVCEDVAAQQDAAIAPDGAGGAFVAWVDFRSPPSKIATQHVLASGDLDPAWPHFGRVVVANPDSIANAAGGQSHATVVADGTGGVIAVWQDDRSAVTGTDVYAQHILANGKVDEAWPANGTALVTADGIQSLPVAVPDGAGGAIVAWMDGRPGALSLDVYAQHVLASGLVDPAWPTNGLAVSTAAGPQEFPVIVGDGAGGAIVAWVDHRSGTTGFDIYAQRVLFSGTVDLAWPMNGFAVCAATGDQFAPSIASDGAGNSIVAWTDMRVLGSTRIFAERVISSGVADPRWPVNGQAISPVSTPEPSLPRLVADGAGGAIVTWHYFNGHWNQVAQHVRQAGVVDPAWPAEGRLLAPTGRDQVDGVAVSDDQGGAVIAWSEAGDVVAQRVLSTGALDPAYPDTGRVVCGLFTASGPVLAATGAGGAIAAWTDTRAAASMPDIYAMQVLEAITTGVPESTPLPFALARPGPNPARESVTLRFSLPSEAAATLAIYDVQGRRVRALASGPRAAGPHAVSWDLRDDRGRAVASGLYFARLEAGGRTFTAKISTLR